MSHALPLSTALTVLFALTGAGYLAFACRPGSDGIARVSDVLHVLMSVAMLAMPWSWGTTVAPPVLQVVVFGIGTAFYLVLVLSGGRLGRHDHHGPGGSGRLVLGYHVLMMGAMVVMGVMMLPTGSGSAMSMPGIRMSSGHDMSGGHATSGPTWSGWTPVSWVLVVLFGLATLWLLVRVVASARARLHPLARVDGVLLTLMSAGMALAFIPTT